MKARIAILCNNRMAFPALGVLMESGQLVAIGVPEGNDDVVPYLEHITANSNVTLTKFNKASFAQAITDFVAQSKADALFIMTFPWLVPNAVLSALQGKAYNFHYGLLPEMKGADPVFEAIRQRRNETGITVHIATSKIDEGPIVVSRRFPIDGEITHGLLSTIMGQCATEMTMELAQMIESGNLPNPTTQSGGKYYPRPGIEDVRINWNSMDSDTIYALARACNPWNKGVYCGYGLWNFRIIGFSHTNTLTNCDLMAGTITFADDNEAAFVCCSDKKSLKIETISTDEGFFPGYKLRLFGLKSGDVLQ